MTSWPNIHIDALCQMWPNHSASQIAAHLTNSRFPCSRNSVIGKARRLGLPMKKPSSGRPKTVWSPVAEAIVLERWGAGCSLAEIARELWDRAAFAVTTKTVSAKARDMGLPRNPRPRMARRDERLPIKFPTLPTMTPAVTMAAPEASMISTLDLKANHCRFPIGDPRQPGFGYCGATKWDHSRSYCEFHHRLCWRPPEKRENRVREAVAA